MELLKNERLDDLEYKGLKIIQDKTKYCFTSDAVLLSNFAKANSSDTVVDLCTGSGIIATLMYAKNNPKKVYGIELQKYLFDLAVKSAKLNGLDDKITFINSQIQDATKYIKAGSVSVVTVNPPYEKVDGHYLSGDEQIDICKYEKSLNLTDVIKVSSDLLKFGGKLFMVHKSSRLTEIITLLKKYNLEPKILRFIQPKAQLNSNVVLIKAIKGGKAGLQVEPTLILTDENGEYSKELKKIYNKE
ncbi:MAG: tRNA1(Val) (adenine(37)-N6)-methyltransferase [Spirochaetales bacterium]